MPPGRPQTGAITFTAGRNITITQVGTNFTFEASGGDISTSGWSNFSQSTPKTVPVQDTSTILLEPNPDRLYASFTNNQDELIYLQYGIPAEFGVGYPVAGRSSWIMDLSELNLVQINAVCASGLSVDIDVIEGVA